MTSVDVAAGGVPFGFGGGVRWLGVNGQFGLRSSHLFYETEESSFAVGVDAPVHGHRLIPVRIRIKVAPRGVRAEGFHHVIDRLVEVEVIVFVK